MGEGGAADYIIGLVRIAREEGGGAITAKLLVSINGRPEQYPLYLCIWRKQEQMRLLLCARSNRLQFSKLVVYVAEAMCESSVIIVHLYLLSGVTEGM